MSSVWTDELRQEVIQEYTDKNPTAENTTEIISEIANARKLTVNGIRMILSKAEVYVAQAKKTATASTGDADKPKRRSKQESLDDLTAVLTKHEVEVDDAIISKLTGKAADYFTGAFNHIIEE